MHSNQRSSRTLVVAGLAVIAALIGWLLLQKAPTPSGPAQSDGQASEGLKSDVDQAAALPGSHGGVPLDQNRARRQTDPTEYAGHLIAGLTNVTLIEGRLAPDQVGNVRQDLAALVARGNAALPVIREFLQKNQDVPFGKGSGDTVGASSLRTGLLQAVGQIGGAEAVALSRDVLKTTSDPAEIALISRNLESLAPGQFTTEVMDAARQGLMQGQTNGADVGMLVQALASYGGTNVAPELEQMAPKWNYYATMGLAGLPDGQGIPALSRMAADSSETGIGNRDFAFEMLAQISSKYPDASSALVNFARQNQIPDSAWRQIADVLAGVQFQFSRSYPDNMFATVDGDGLRTYRQPNGNQNFISTQVSGDPASRLALIDQLLATTSAPSALDALKQARARLTGAQASK